jgi:hypothetical protein
MLDIYSEELSARQPVDLICRPASLQLDAGFQAAAPPMPAFDRGAEQLPAGKPAA